MVILLLESLDIATETYDKIRLCASRSFIDSSDSSDSSDSGVDEEKSFGVATKAFFDCRGRVI